MAENKPNYSYSYPSYNIEDSKKDEEWHKQFVLAITKDSLGDSYNLDNSLMNECVKYYKGTQSGDEYRFMQEAEDGDVLPAKWINFNKIQSKIDILVGELIRKSFEIRVKATNREAKVKALEYRNDVKVDMIMQPLNNQVAEISGMGGSFLRDDLPKNDEELDLFMSKKYKDKTEIVVEGILKWIAKKNNLNYTRLSMFRDLLIMGKCFCRTELINGIPVTRRIDPRFMIYDKNSQHDLLIDSTYFGEARYMNAADCAERYNLSLSEIKEAYNTWEKTNRGSRGGVYDNMANISANVNVPIFQSDQGQLRVLVCSAVFSDHKSYDHKISKDKYGNEHIKKTKSSRKKKGEKLIQKRIKTWRQGTLIGGQIFKEWGECENNVRDYENLGECMSPYQGLVINMYEGGSPSKVNQLKALQDLKNIALYNLQLDMARSGPKGFVFDVAQSPPDWSPEKVIKYLKTSGIAFIDSTAGGGFNQFTPIDMSLSNNVKNFLEVSFAIDREMDSVSGINEARQGIVENSSQAVGVTQSALVQSSLSTETYFDLFRMLTERILTYTAGLIKITALNEEKFTHIVGEAGVSHIKDLEETPLNDYDVFIDVVPPEIDDKQKLQSIVLAALQAGQVDFVNAIKIIREDDVSVAIRMLENHTEEMEMKRQMEVERQMQMQQQMQEQQLMANRESESRKEKVDLQKAREQMDLQKQLERLKGEFRSNEIDRKGIWDSKLSNKKENKDNK